MRSRRVSKPSELRSWIVVLEQGEEAKHLLIQWATREKIENASFVALGAFEKAVVGYFDIEKKEYQPIPIAEQVEVITLVGDIFPDDRGNPSLHGHAVPGRRDGSTRGGHLLEGYVRPTLEVAVTELPAHLRRHMHPELGVALIEPA